ncbi:lysylphosphatidylglycerol synthase transmembrane domain-containing protein [uncultured Fibrobacter sp.]|uniref:lysylphosphatidylglycerol synthase transmembrane domain-containing protein n=1 Tax=uncultured Fibrobacter sp. TaxID=261512 RepID=UPI0026343EAC|nr:lysylphosphatidylglycerol synthase transmembrane domain-containing protein [uncultured Fibrobacter sp.]
MQDCLRKKLTKAATTMLKASVTIGGIVYIFNKIPFFDAISNWQECTLPWLLFIFALTIVLMMIQANRWRGLLLDEGRSIPFRTFYAYIALGYFFNNLLPSGFGGDAVKTIAFGKRFGNTANSVAAIAISRIMGLIAMFLSFFVALPFVLVQYQIPTIYTLTVSLVAIIALVLIIGSLFSDKIHIPNKLAQKLPFLSKLQQAFTIYRSHPKAFWLSGLDSIWLQIVTIIIHYAYFKAVGIDVGIAVITVFTTIMVTFTMLPISINGIGIRENVQVSLYSGLLGIPPDIVLASTLLSYLPLLFQASQGAVVLMLNGKRKRNI